MRSGLQKPGAVPFLALLVFLLLSLVPSLAKEWDLYSFRFGYLGYRRPDARHVPRATDALVDVQPLLRTDSGQSKSYLDRTDQSLLDRKSRPRRAALDSLAENLFETAPVLDGLITRPVEKPSSLVRGVRAFRSLVSKQVDEQLPIPQPSSLDNSGKTDPTLYTPTVDLPVAPTTPAVGSLRGLDEKGHTRGLTNKTNGTESKISFHFHATWQRACHFAHHLQTFFASHELLNKKPRISHPTTSYPKENIRGQFHSHDYDLSEGNCSQTPAPEVASVVLPEKVPHVNSTATPTHTPEPAAAEAQAANLDRDPERLRGSCMAIVISIVVGVMWF